MKSTCIQGPDVKHPIVKSLIISILNKTPSENWKPNKPSLTMCSLPDCGEVKIKSKLKALNVTSLS